MTVLQKQGARLVLASASASRQKLLEAAGLSFEVMPANVDEDAIRQALTFDGDQIAPEDLAEVLARAKAEDVSKRVNDAWVIGGDQILAVGDELHTKASNKEEAQEKLLGLRGKTHALHSAVVVAKAGETAWAHVETARMTVRDFSPEFLGNYFSAATDAVLGSVGCYHYEGVGIHLFDKVDGDFSTILGMPMLPLLAHLREQGVVLS